MTDKVMVDTYTEARAAGNPNKLAMAITIRELSTVHDLDLTETMLKRMLKKEGVFIPDNSEVSIPKMYTPKRAIIAAIEISLNLVPGELNGLSQVDPQTLKVLHEAVHNRA